MNAGEAGDRFSIVDFAAGTDGDYDLWSCLVGQELEHVSNGEGKIVDVQRRRNLPPLIHVRFSAHGLTLFTPDSFAKGVFTRLRYPPAFDERVAAYIARKTQQLEEEEAQVRRSMEEAEARTRARGAQRQSVSPKDGRGGDECQRRWREYVSLRWPAPADSRDPDCGKVEEQVASLKCRLIERQQRDRQAIEECLQRRRIRHLVHFTRIENLESILRRGVVPRASLREGEFLWNDEMRIDGYPEASCLSVSFPNYKMFYDLRENRYPGARWAVVLLSPEVLATHPCMFFRSNAAWNGSRKLARSNEDSVTGIEGLEGIFSEDLPGLRATLGLPDHYTTDPQAEVLVFDVVSTVLLRGVRIAEHDAELSARLKAIAPAIEVGTDRALFEWREDFAYWKDRRGARARESGFVDDIPF